MSNNNLVGGFVVSQRGNEIHTATSNIADHVLKLEKDRPEFNNLQSILDQIYYIIMKTNFTSKFAYKDEFSEICYSEDNDNVIGKRISGCDSIVRQPAGMVLFHKKNQLLFDCLEIQYYIDHKIFPISMTDLDYEILYDIHRSDGSIHKSIIDKQQSIRYSTSKDDFIIGQNFHTNKSEPKIGSYPDLIKHVYLSMFAENNNINIINIKIPYLDPEKYNLDECDVSNDLLEELINYYNTEIDKYINSTYSLFDGFTTVNKDKNTIQLVL